MSDGVLADRTPGLVGEAERGDASGAVLAEVTTAAMSVRSSSAAHQLRALEPERVLEHVRPGTDIIVPLANGEPVSLLDAVEAAADQLDGVRVNQMHALHDRPYLHGAFGARLEIRSIRQARPCGASRRSWRAGPHRADGRRL